MKIICIGRNYAEHIEELDGRRDIPSAPVFFCKPDTALLRNNDPFYVPAFSREVHYETELVVRIGRVARAIDERFAPRCYDEVGLGIDFTARDLQRDCIARRGKSARGSTIRPPCRRSSYRSPSWAATCSGYVSRCGSTASYGSGAIRRR